MWFSSGFGLPITILNLAAQVPLKPAAPAAATPTDAVTAPAAAPALKPEDEDEDGGEVEQEDGVDGAESPFTSTSPTLTESLPESMSDEEPATAVPGVRRWSTGDDAIPAPKGGGLGVPDKGGARRVSVSGVPGKKGGVRSAVPLPAKVVAEEKEREKLLTATGDFCGGRGGELGRRLEAWLCVNGDAEGRVELPQKWDGEDAAGA